MFIKNYLFCLLICLFFICNTQGNTNKPNVIFFLVDDLGWMDIGCMGEIFYETPSIDQLAKEGVLFTNAYAAHPVCGPSRASLLSGKIPLRLGNTGVVGNLKANNVTIAEAFKEHGYSTFFSGKWHVGLTEGRSPKKQGFDHSVAVNSEGQPGSYFFPYKDTGTDGPDSKRQILPKRDVPDLEDGLLGEYLTDRLTDETIEFIEKNKNEPFFVYLSHYAVHTPLEGKPEYVSHFELKNKALGNKNIAKLEPIEGRAYWRQNRSNPIYGAMIESLDESLGRLINRLKELALYDNTIIVFTSDNGGLSCLNVASPHISTTNLPLKYGKGWLYEGGIRVPAIIKCPQMEDNGIRTDIPICGYDFYPTILKLAGLPLKDHQHVDGEAWYPGKKVNK